MNHSQLVNLFDDSKEELEASGLSVMTYFKYCQLVFPNSPTYELVISNRFPEFPDPEDGSQASNEDLEDQDEILDDNHDEATDANDGITELGLRSEQRKKIEKIEQRL
jgi:hypothetical protein